MVDNRNQTLFIFLDESGNLDFSPRGSRYWSLTALSTFSPIEGRDQLTALLYELAGFGVGQEFFHATEDLQSIRDQVFQRINKMPDDFEIHSVIAEKRKANPSLYEEMARRAGAWSLRTNPDDFYSIVCRTLLTYIFRRWKYRQAKRVVVILSAIFNGPRHAGIKQTLRKYLKGKSDLEFHIYFHATKADLNCQMADYCGWAISIKWERGDTRSYDLVKHRIKSEFDIFRSGTSVYY